MTPITRRCALAALLAPVAVRAAASPLGLLGEPGVPAVMRHALAPGAGDPPGFRLEDPATQRRLNDVGRAQARAAGAAARTSGARVAHVLSSAWDRCLETARLMDFGTVRVAGPLNAFFADRLTAQAQTEATRALLAALPRGESAFCVTHQVNVTALTGVFPTSGEILVFRLAGRVEALGRVTPG
jgi:phosphohistidine phosphatase SixA